MSGSHARGGLGDPPITGDLPITVEIQCSSADLSAAVDVASIGYNSALSREPQIDTAAVPLGLRPDFVPPWKPRRIPIRCIGITLPEGQEYLPSGDVSETSSDGMNLHKPRPKPVASDGTEKCARPKRTRVQPPAGAVSLQDRLFYLLQPPLES